MSRSHRTADREWRNTSRRPVPRGTRKPARRAEPGILRYIGPVIRAVIRALWRYINHK